jgi:hypothetical protein
MMHVNVDDGNAFDLLPVGIFHVRRSDGNIVYIAKPISLFLITNIIFERLAKDACVVSRWPDCTKGIPVLRCHDLIASFDDGTSRLESC